MDVAFYRHGLSAADAASVAAVLETPFLTSGAVCKQVEAQLCTFFGTSHAFLTNSWTNGAIAALLALGIGAGDEVIVPAMTFIATANVVELVSARPVFVDVDPRTLLMTADAVAAALTPATRAVIPVHLYGQMCDMKAIRAVLASRPDVAIIEDAAHSFEAAREGYLPGQLSDMALFSFYATKNVTCGEGGALVTNRTDLVDRLHSARLHGMTKGAADRFQGGRYNHWDMVDLGTKANLPDLLAALLPQQIDSIRERLATRAAVANRYRAAFADMPLRLPEVSSGCISAEHIFPVHVAPAIRDSVIGELNKRGVNVAVNYRSVPNTSYYKRKYSFTPAQYPVSDDWGEGTITLPLYPGLPCEQQDYVIICMRSALDMLASDAGRPHAASASAA
jgi:UDP-4-amino-4-deoxy-L-arabinose-oxoglutarate aminotransferase